MTSIHAFGENGELSDGARLALQPYVKTVNGTAPDAAGNVSVDGDGGVLPDATDTAKGIVQLAGDLGGTADAPTVPGLADKADASHTHDAADLTGGTVSTARLPNASTTARGIVELATNTEAATGTDTARVVTPANMKPLLDAKAPASHTHDAGDLTGVVKTVNGTAPDGSGNVDVEGGALFYPIPPPGGYLGPSYTVFSSNAGGPYASSIVEVVPIRVGAPMIAQGFNLRMGTNEEGVTGRVFLFASDAEGHPSTVIASSTFDCTSGAYKGVSIPPVSLAAGLYWGAISTDAGVAVRFYAVQAPLPYMTDTQYISERAPRVNIGAFADPPASVSGFASFGTTQWAPNIQIRRAN